MSFDTTKIWAKYEQWQNSDEYKIYQSKKLSSDQRIEKYKNRTLKLGDCVKYPDYDPSRESIDLEFIITSIYGQDCTSPIEITSKPININGGRVIILVNAYSVDLVHDKF